MTILQDRIARGAAMNKLADQERRLLAGLLWDECRTAYSVSKKFEELDVPSQNLWLRIARVAVRYAREHR